MEDVYYFPEEYSLKLIGTVDQAGAWEYDMIGVWTDGRFFYTATDSGCSCTWPFKHFRSADDLARHNTAAEVVNDINAWVGPKPGPDDYEYGRPWADVREAADNLITAVWNA